MMEMWERTMTKISPLRQMRAACALFAVSILLAACGGPTPYGGADQRGYGYSETRIEQNRYRVKFAGNSATARETVENYLLYRSAELTVDAGYDFFVIETRATDKDTYYRSTFDDFPGYGFYYHRFPYHRGYGYGGSVSTTTRPITQYTAYADIVMFKGAKDDRNVKAFNAADVLRTLGPRIRRPEPPAS